jgi:hypothetical protein
MTNHSLQDFLGKNDLDFLQPQDELELPSIDLEYFRAADFELVNGRTMTIAQKEPGE